jgi:hypothetical protein
MSFTKKHIDVTFTLGQGQFGTSGSNSVTVSGLRVSVDIAKAGGISRGELSMRIYGLDLPTMSQLSKVGRLALSNVNNKVLVSAGDDESGMSTIFQGWICEAWADFNAMPDVYLTVNAQAGGFEAIQPVAPRSYKGTVDAAVVMANIAASCNLAFENGGVSVILSNPYFPGTATAQFEACKAAAGINGQFNDNGVLAIWPRDGSRGGLQPLISPSGGMVGYPRFNATGITVKTLFNPAVIHGGTVQVQSSLQPACGTWRVNTMAHNIESKRVGGAWFTTLECSSLDRVVLK